MGGSNLGCALITAALVMALLIGGAIWLTSETTKLADAEAQRIDASARMQDAWGRSQAMIIQAQGQARLDSAQAFTIVAIAAVPWLTISTTLFAALAFLGCCVAIVALRLSNHGVRERVLVLPPGYGRRELCEMGYQLDMGECQIVTRTLELPSRRTG